jgi:hypothetical protein
VLTLTLTLTLAQRYSSDLELLFSVLYAFVAHIKDFWTHQIGIYLYLVAAECILVAHQQR